MVSSPSAVDLLSADQRDGRLNGRRPSRHHEALLAHVHDAIAALHQRAWDATDAVARRIVGPATIAVAPRSAEVIGSHGVPGQTLVSVVVSAIVGSDLQPRRRLRLVEPQRNSALIGPADGQRRAAYERGDGNGNLPCAYRLHGRSPKMNFNATTPTQYRGGGLL